MSRSEQLVRLRPRVADPVVYAPSRYIHLLYAPTNFCNLGCKYCYLGTGTDAPRVPGSPLDTLRSTVERMAEIGVVPFNLSFHGGEPTAIPAPHLEELFAYARDHYAAYGEQIRRAGFPLNPIHIKTNLFNFHQLEELFDRYGVSVSASVDLPLSLHGRYRCDKKGRSTLDRTLENLQRLARYAHHKKISCVVTRAHYEQLDGIVSDIRMIHQEIGLDMTKFNVMFSFDSHRNHEKFEDAHPELEMLSSDEQVAFYRRLHDEFVGTDLEEGLRRHWFKEFTPEFCCSAVNCGDKFFLLQRNGDVYSCPRGQSSPRFRYGNVFEREIEEILAAGSRTIEAIENRLPLHDDCVRCEYVPYCNTGCTFVREESGCDKSYTCKLQKVLYGEDPERFPPYSEREVAMHVKRLKLRNDIRSIMVDENEPSKPRYVTPELEDPDNALRTLIDRDPVLTAIFDPGLFRLDIDGVVHELQSATLVNRCEIGLVRDDSRVRLSVRKDAFELGCEEPVNNHLHLMLLRNTLVTYGDEQRRKQEHLADYSLYARSLSTLAEDGGDVWWLDLRPWLTGHRALFLPGVCNKLFVTTRALREYHYRKQHKNAFYHIQAINLPFAHLEFHWRTSGAGPEPARGA